MRRREFIMRIENAACTAMICLMLIVLPSSRLNAEQLPPKGCVAVSKTEYDSAKRQYLLRTRFSRYVITGRVLKRAYWYCQ
jgi:hypothetical protein